MYVHFLINCFMFLNHWTAVWLSWVTAVSGAVHKLVGNYLTRLFLQNLGNTNNTIDYGIKVYILTASDPLMSSGWFKSSKASTGWFCYQQYCHVSSWHHSLLRTRLTWLNWILLAVGHRQAPDTARRERIQSCQVWRPAFRMGWFSNGQTHAKPAEHEHKWRPN